jgi:predicted DNA-binding protein (MmcQ/YjbR family)
MAHPRTYSDRDPYLKDVRKVCLALPDAVEIEAWGRPTFRTGPKGKIFAMFGGDPFAVIFKPDPEDDAALRTDDRFWPPPYWGPGGWLGLDLAKAPVDWDEVAELVEGSYRQVALKRQVKLLDGG